MEAIDGSPLSDFGVWTMGWRKLWVANRPPSNSFVAWASARASSHHRSEIRRNQHALRAASPRTPTPVLLALLRACSFRLENEAVASRFRCELGLVAPLLPTAPPPLLRNRSVS